MSHYWPRAQPAVVSLGVGLMLTALALTENVTLARASSQPRPQAICANPTEGGAWNYCITYDPSTNAAYVDNGPGTKFDQKRNHKLHAWELADAKTGNCLTYGQNPDGWTVTDPNLGYFYETRCIDSRTQAFRWLPTYGGGLDVWVLAGHRFLSMDGFGNPGAYSSGKLLVGLPASQSGYPTALWKFGEPR